MRVINLTTTNDLFVHATVPVAKVILADAIDRSFSDGLDWWSDSFDVELDVTIDSDITSVPAFVQGMFYQE